jgi:5,10-methylenetetrahydrofolate reductase
MLKITIEKQRAWQKEDQEKKLRLSNKNIEVEGFTITDLPFSSVVQAYWFLAAFIGNVLLGKLSWWQDTDSYFFYKNTLGSRKPKEFISIFLKLHKRLLDHHGLLEELKYTPKAIATVAANGRLKKTLFSKIDLITKKQILGIFLVSGGGIFQRFFRKIPPFNLLLTSSGQLFSYARNKYPYLKIFAATNPNLESETLERLLTKHKNVQTDKYENLNALLTQPPFVWSKFGRYLSEITSHQNTKNIEIRVGVPIFTSPWNVRFWMQLVSVNWKKEKEAEELVKLFEQKYQADKTEKKLEFKEFSKQWTLNLISKIQNLQNRYSQITGIHLMPMGNYIPVEEIISSISLAENSHYLSKIKYETIKYKNHFYELDENLKEEDKFYLEPEFVPQSESIIWYFNKTFWDHLDPFMEALGKDYKKTIGGTADANTQLIKYSVQQFVKQMDDCDLENVSYVELGAAGTEWAKEFISEFKKISPNKNFTYVFVDFSNDVLNKAKASMWDNYMGVEMKYLLSTEATPKNILRIHATNIYDNYPYDRFLLDNKKLYQIQVKTYISKSSLDELTLRYANNIFTKEKIQTLVKNFIQNTKKYANPVESFLSEIRKLANDQNFYGFWQDFWNAVKFEEKYTPQIQQLKILQIFNSLENEKIEFSSSVEAERDIIKKINSLAKGGCLEIIDIITQNPTDYKNFLGPVKYDASLANYLNGPLLTATISEKYKNIQVKSQSLKDFGGKRNQMILEITKV